MKNLRVIGGYTDIRVNGEDLVLTPFLFLVYVNSKNIKILGLGICWFYHSAYLGLSEGIPTNKPWFISRSFKKEHRNDDCKRINRKT